MPSPNAGFVAVAGGEGYSLGLQSDGSIVAWGSNEYGQCDLPVANTNFVAVAAGLRHALAIKTTLLTGGGTDNYIPKWFAPSELEDSLIYQTDAGNIGIGTTSPSAQLHLYTGTFLLGTSSAKQLRMRDAGNAVDIESIGVPLYINNTSGQPTYLMGGNVGIGTTSPGVKLHVASAPNLNTWLRLQSTGTFGSTTALGTVVGNNRKETQLQYENVFLLAENKGAAGILPTFYIAPGGNVGIGTTSPGEKLHLYESNANTDTTLGIDGAAFTSGTHFRGIRFRSGGAEVGAMQYKYSGGTETVELGASGSRRLDFYTAATTRMTVDPTGKVGIGITSPAARLHIGGASDPGTAPENIGLLANLGGPTTPTFAAGTKWGVVAYANTGGVVGSANQCGVSGYSYGTNDSSRAVYGVTPNGGASWADYFTGNVHASGKVMIGTTYPYPGTYLLAVNGQAAKPGGGSWASLSDARLKQIHGSYERGLSEILRLNPVTFNYTAENELKLPSDRQFVGLVAQEVRETIPEAVEENGDGYLMMNNDPIIWAMANAIKELNTQNEQLRQRVDVLENRPAQVVKDLQSENESLRQRLALLERRLERLGRDGSHIVAEVLP